MAGDVYKKVQIGERLRIPAVAYNAFIDAARAGRGLRQGRAGLGTGNAVQAHDQVLVQNASGEPRGRFDVLGIDGPLITPTENLDQFESRLALRGMVPSAEHAGRFAIVTEALDDDAIGRAVVAGVIIARVQMEDEAHGFAECLAGASDRLKSSASGSAQLLWVEPVADRIVPEIAWTVLRLGSGARAIGQMFAVLATVDGGAAGSATASCSYTYQVKALDGTVLGAGKSPERRRYPETPYTLTPSDTPGAAYFDEGGVLHLWDANELPDSEEEC